MTLGGGLGGSGACVAEDHESTFSIREATQTRTEAIVHRSPNAGAILPGVVNGVRTKRWSEHHPSPLTPSDYLQLDTVERPNLRFTVPPGMDFDRIEANLRFPPALITTER